MNKKILWIITVIIILIGAGYFLLPWPYFVLDQQKPPSEKMPPISESEQIIISGEMTCLPKIGPDPHTMECTIGLKGTNGRHYGLRNLSELDLGYKFFVTGLQVEVSGMFNPEEIKGLDGNKYDVVGVIDVISIKEIRD